MIEFKNLCFSYGNNVIFDNFSAVIDGSITCLKAPSGRGKTTLLRLIAGLETPMSGEITGIPEKISYMFRENRLFPWLTARQNVAAVLSKESRNTAGMWLERVGMGDFADRTELSGGQLRRTALARALAYGGDLLLLDEPFTGLDAENIQRCAGLIRDVNVPVIAAIHSDDEISMLGEKVKILTI